MKLLEYEAKGVLAEAEIEIPLGQVVGHGDNLTGLNLPAVLKSQVPVGGRGKAGGVRIVNSLGEINTVLDDLFKLDIKGHKPRKVLLEEKLSIQRELYLSLTINRAKGIIEIIAHPEGGVEVESNNTSDFTRLTLSHDNHDVVGQALADAYNLPDYAFGLQDMTEKLYACFTNNDATLIEINPLILTNDGHLVAGDCKITLDDAAEFRHPEWDFEDKPASANFVVLDQDGEIATIANGAGLAMATVDFVADAELKPANFLDIGGGASAESVLSAFHKLLDFPKLKGIIINIFAGITRCDEVARAIITASSSVDNLPPLYIRLEGTNSQEARDLLVSAKIPMLNSLDACIQAAKGKSES